MKFFERGAIIGLMAMAISTTGMAQDEAEEESKAADTGWSGKGEAGLVKTTGNTETESLLMGLAFVREADQWRHHAGINALSSEDSGVTTAERYGFDWQSDYKLSSISWLLGAFRYESDKFSSYDNQQSLTFGYGRTLLDNGSSKLVGEIGVGYRQAELLVSGITESGAIIRGLLDFQHQLTDNSELTNRLLVESGSDNTFIRNLSGVSVAMNDKFAMKFGFEYRRNSDVPFGKENTDTITSANLVYNFK